MASYYYLISSLPMLRPNEEPPLDYSAFLGMCKTALNDAVYRDLAELTVYADRGPLLDEWAAFYRQLCEELNYQRRVKLGRNAAVPTCREPDITEEVSAAVNAANPLEGEQVLLRLEFSRLDAMIGLHYFDAHALYGYAMKLKLLERQQSLHREAGRAAFQGLLAGLEQQIFSI